MKHTRNSFPLIVMGALALLLYSCSLQEEVEPGTLTPQLVQDNPNMIFCQECDNGCVVGYEFSSGNPFGTHPQGGYKLAAYIGDCECERNGSIYHLTTYSNTTTHVAMIGGPASGSIPDPMAHAFSLFNFTCQNSGSNGGIGGGTFGGVQVGQSWSNFTHQMQNSGLNNPGIVAWPDDWNIRVGNPGSNGEILVELPYAAQYQSLEEIRIVDMSTADLLATLTANGEDEYLLDLSELPLGAYMVQLKFVQGFSLNTAVVRYNTEG